MNNKTQPDIYRDGRWLKRSYLGDKYTWTVSGVLWNNIKERCTPGSATQKREPSYVGSKNEFESFESFVEWNREQVGYGLGYEVDSDILKPENKIYSRDTCLLIPGSLNKFLQAHPRSRFQVPVGMTLKNGKLWVRLLITDDVTGRKMYLLNRILSVEDVELAEQMYLEAAREAVRIWIERLEKSGRYNVDQRVIEYLKNWTPCERYK